MKPVTRRNFVRHGSLAVGMLIGTGLLPDPILPAATAFAKNAAPVFEESVCTNHGKRILVAYESLCGTTSRVATHIADTLCSANFQVDVKKIDNIENITVYDGAVIGSAVKSASWYPNAIDFVNENKHHFARIPVAYFLTCLALYDDTAQAKATADSYFTPVLKAVPEVNPTARQAFAGVLDYDKLNMVIRMVMKSKMKKKGIPEGDFRDFDKIGTWTREQVLPALVNES